MGDFSATKLKRGEEVLDEIIIILIGLVVGVVVGITSVGMGHLGVPTLILLAGLEPITAVTTLLIQGVVMKTAGMISFIKQKAVIYPIAFYLLFLGVPFAYAGGLLNTIDFETNLRFIIAIILLFISLLFIFETLISKNVSYHTNSYNLTYNLSSEAKFLLIFIGGAIGLIVGITAIGGGSLIITTLLVLGVPVSHAVGTTMFAGLMMTAIATLPYILSGGIDYALPGIFLVGSLPGIYIGTKVHKKLPIAHIRILIAIIVLLAALKILFGG